MTQLISAGRPFLCRDAGASGLSRSVLDQARHDHRLRQMFRGAVVDARVPDSRRLRAQALAMLAPPDAVFYGETVAWLLGLDVYRPRDRHEMVPRCVVPHGSSRVRRVGVRCREGYLPPTDVEVVEGLAVTTPLRTTTDLLRTSYRPHALAAADAFAAAGLVDPAEVQAACVRLRGYPGIVQARGLAELIDAGAQSPGESWARLRVVDGGLPRPQTQVEIRDRRGRVIAFLDMGYTEHLVGMEFDGRRDHTSDDDVEHDLERRTRLFEDHGWTVVVVRNEDVWAGDEPFEGRVASLIGSGVLPRNW